MICEPEAVFIVQDSAADIGPNPIDVAITGTGLIILPLLDLGRSFLKAEAFSDVATQVGRQINRRAEKALFLISLQVQQQTQQRDEQERENRHLADKTVRLEQQAAALRQRKTTLEKQQRVNDQLKAKVQQLETELSVKNELLDRLSAGNDSDETIRRAP